MAKENGPPGGFEIDLSQLEKLSKLPKLNLPNLPGGGGVLILAILALIVVLISGAFFTVAPEEEGIVLRFGKFARTASPGFNLKIPGIETVTKLPVQRQLKEEFGFRTISAGVRSEYTSEGYADESLMLTGDLNIADVEWVVQFRIAEPLKYLFRVNNVEETFRAMSEAVMREVVGDRTVNEVLTIGRQEVANLVEVQLQDLCDQYSTGIKVDQVVLQNVTPPDRVKPSFNDVNQAEQEKEEKINAARSDYNREVPRARGRAQQTVSQAEGYALDRVNRAEGDAALFRAVYLEYRKAPEATRKRIYLETMNDVLPKSGRKIVVDDEIRGLLPLLNLEGRPRSSQAADGGGQ